MNNSQFANLQVNLEELTFVQLKRIRQHVEDMISSNHVGKAITVHEEGVAECAHCGSHFRSQDHLHQYFQSVIEQDPVSILQNGYILHWRQSLQQDCRSF